jgi:hypothetical protein
MTHHASRKIAVMQGASAHSRHAGRPTPIRRSHRGDVPGWVSTEADIRAWGPFLASHGIVTMTAGTNDAVGDLPPDRATALRAKRARESFDERSSART